MTNNRIMDHFAPGDRVVAINTDMSAPINPPGNVNLHPFRFPDGPLRKDVVYHVAATRTLPCGRQSVFLTGMRVLWGQYDIPWDYSRFRKVDTLRDRPPRKRRRKHPAPAKQAPPSKAVPPGRIPILH